VNVFDESRWNPAEPLMRKRYASCACLACRLAGFVFMAVAQPIIAAANGLLETRSLTTTFSLSTLILSP
jgi:hypothetical protein